MVIARLIGHGWGLRVPGKLRRYLRRHREYVLVKWIRPRRVRDRSGAT